MRSDMAKVLVERPRIGGNDHKYGRSKQSAKMDPESAPCRETIKPKARGLERKHLNENLAPLRRFLLKNVGRPWDKVRSEISEHVKRSNAVQNHIFEHLDGYVTKDVILVDGYPYTVTYGGLRSIASRYDRRGYSHLYVCPKSGLLKIAKAPPKEKTDSIEVRRVDPYTCIAFVKGCWWQCQMANADCYIGVSANGQYVIDKTRIQNNITDALFGWISSSSFLMNIYGKVGDRFQYTRSAWPLRREESRRLLQMTRDR